MDGVSMVYTFADAKAKDQHVTQFFEMLGNRLSIMMVGWHGRSAGRPGKLPRAAA